MAVPVTSKWPYPQFSVTGTLAAHEDLIIGSLYSKPSALAIRGEGRQYGMKKCRPWDTLKEPSVERQ